MFREAIDRGSAHDEGETELDGRIVHRIRLEPRPDGDCPREASYVYVDPDNSYPVEIRAAAYTDMQKVGDLVFRYQTFEYLPRTAANLELTDIQAQHHARTRAGRSRPTRSYRRTRRHAGSLNPATDAAGVSG